MYDISTRLDALNRQLVIISKLQRMEEEYNLYPHGICKKEDSAQRAACLKEALETAEEQRKVAMDLVKQSKNQTDSVKTDRNELLNEITKLQQQIIEITHKNTDLMQERNELKGRLQSLSEDESKKY